MGCLCVMPVYVIVPVVHELDDVQQKLFGLLVLRGARIVVFSNNIVACRSVTLSVLKQLCLF